MTTAPDFEETLFEEIVEESGAPPADSPHGDGFIDPMGATWERQADVPMSKGHRIFMVFRVKGELGEIEDAIVYAVPKDGGKSDPMSFRRFTLALKPKLGHPVLFTEGMTRDVFVRECADAVWEAFEESTEGASLRDDADAMRACLEKIKAAGGGGGAAAAACLKLLTVDVPEGEPEPPTAPTEGETSQ